MSDPFIGEIRPFTGSFAPVGWLLCTGQLVAVSDYEELFTLIGTTYGGDGASTFGIPDLASRVPIHRSATFATGSTGGTESVALTQLQTPAHSHSFMAGPDLADESAAANFVIASSDRIKMYISDSPDGSLSPRTVGNSGGNQSHPNIQPYGTATYIIAVAGIWPSRP